MNFSALHEKLNQYINKGRLKSPWVVHYDCGSCNGCDIEVLACLTPVFDVERFGIVNIGDPKHADVLLVTGTVNQRNKDVLKNIYDQMPEPKAVIAIGACACTGGVFQDCYNVVGGVDHVIPVDVYVPGCAAKPEAIIDGVVLALEVVKGKLGLRDMPQTTIFEIAEFGRRMGMPAFSLSPAGLAALDVERLGRLHLELAENAGGRELLVYLARAVPEYDVKAPRRVLERCHYRHADPMPLSGGLHKGHIILLTRFPERQATAAGIEKAVQFLGGVMDAVANA